MTMDKLINGAIGLGIVGIVVVVVMAILQGFQSSGAVGVNAGNSTAYAALDSYISGLTNFATFGAVIALTVIGFFVIRLVRKSQSGGN